MIIVFWKFSSSLIGPIGFPTLMKIDFMNENIFLIIPGILYKICVRLTLFLFEIVDRIHWGSHLVLGCSLWEDFQ